MVKLKRQHFDIQGAAEFLELSVSDVEYYIKEGELRYGIDNFYFSQMMIIPLAMLTQAQRKKILATHGVYYVSESSSPVVLSETSFKATKPIKPQQYLYFKHTAIKDCFWFDTGGEEGSAGLIYTLVLEALDCSLVSLWSQSKDESRDWFAAICNVGKFAAWNHHYDDFDYDQPIYPCVLTLEELGRFAEKLTGESTPLVVEEASQDEPFKLPQVTNDIAEAMCEYGNRYFREHSKIPKPAQLRNYMLEHGSDDLKLTYDSREKEFSFGGERLSDRQFKYRRSMYLNNSAD